MGHNLTNLHVLNLDLPPLFELCFTYTLLCFVKCRLSMVMMSNTKYQ